MKTSDIIKRLLKYAKNNVRFFILSVIFSLFGVSLQLATPIITGKAIDNIVSQGNVNFEKVLQIIILLATTIILSTVFQWLTSNFTNALTYKTVSSLRKDAYKKLSQVELKYIDSQSHGDVMT
ncbi:MAG: ABC transporter transmembrane domain-containing protein, partial [Acutalibacteraceae bacterium]